MLNLSAWHATYPNAQQRRSPDNLDDMYAPLPPDPVYREICPVSP